MRRLLGTALVVALGCSNHSIPSPPGTAIRSSLARDSPPNVDAATLAQLVSDDTAFALGDYATIDDGAAVMVYSPYGVSSVMAMLYAASAGDTTTLIATNLHFTLPESEFHPARNALEAALESRNASGITLTTLNQLWSFSDDLTFAPDFLDTLAINYGADVQKLTGTAEENRTTINQWASDATNGKIAVLFPDGSLDGVAFAATNAIYFKGLWKTQFDTSATRQAPFTLLDGTQVDVMTMNANVSAKAYEDNTLTAVDLPYKGATLSLLIVEPASFASYQFTASELQRIVAALSGDISCAVALPKFTAAVQLRLTDALGLAGDLDFSRGVPGFVDSDLRLFQSAFILVDESGTEAAAATGGSGKVNAIESPIPVTIDQPFYAVLRDRGTGEVLFLATVRDPR